ncbi:MAG TPA: DUF177 domain-containing protein [Pyrinomonadaceae bacterium]|jgi:uncharacterized protein|nr:DUF177 domain-containing protein [Pyrinomonadaceae bacterium]
MRIEVENLKEKAEAFSHSYATGEVELEDEGARLVAPAEVRGEASLKGEEVRVRGEIKTEVELLCDRCAAPSRAPLEVEFDTRFIPQALAVGEADNVQLLTEDLGLAAYEDGAVDVDELVLEQILLALPSRNLCREDCKGLCQKCGANLNAGQCSCEQGETDPRWAALADFKRRDG